MFFDISKMNYDDFVKRSKKPYRGSNASPLGWREYSARHFRPLENEEGFALYYRHRGLLDDTKDSDLRKSFAVVRPDNTIEFNNPTSTQSENIMLRNILNTPFYHEKARGGTCISKENIMHPIFKGLRINMDTLKETKPYELYVKKLIHKEAKGYLKQFDEFKIASLTMFNSMNANGVDELLYEVRKSNCYHNVVFFECLEKKHYVDALMHFVLSKYGYWNWADITESRLADFKEVVKQALDKNFNDFVLLNTEVPFQMKMVESGKRFPTSKWGYAIVQDGNKMIRL
jgi:hypothetical protein